MTKASGANGRSRRGFFRRLRGAFPVV